MARTETGGTSREQRARLAASLQAAHEGRLAWVDKLIRQAGYRHASEAVGRSLSRLDLVELVNATGLTTLSNATVGNWIAAGLPRTGNRRLDPAAVIAWLAKERRKPLVTDEDALMAGPSTPALERYRTARAKLSELELEVKRQALVPRVQMESAFREAGRRLRAGFEVIEKRHGRPVGDALRRLLDEVDREVMGALGGGETDEPSHHQDTKAPRKRAGGGKRKRRGG